MSRKHLKHSFSDVQIAAAKTLIGSRPSQLDREAQQVVASEFATQFLATINVDIQVAVFVNEPGWSGRNSFSVDDGDALADISTFRVYLRGFSIINLFRAVGQIINEEELYTDAPVDTTAYAASLYYRARPVLFRKLIRTRKIRIGIKIKETFSTDSWNKLRDAGFVTTDWNGRETISGAPEEWNTLLTSIPAGIVPAGELESGAFSAEEFEREFGMPDPSTDTVTADLLDGMTRDALRVYAAQVNLAGRGSMTADQLRAGLRAGGFTDPNAPVPAEVV